jgi:sarcosine oxidase subunit beta
MKPFIRADSVLPSYDVVVIGGGAHGLATAYYLARTHGVRSVAVLERGYIGSGNSGRNTTILRSNYVAPASVRLYQASLELFETLSQELDYNVFYSRRGLLWMAHSDGSLRAERRRAAVNQAHGINTVFVSPEEIGRICPLLDLSVGGKYPVLGASYHPPGASIRHNAVVWGYAGAAQRLGVHVHQGVSVTGLDIAGTRCIGVHTSAGSIGAGCVVSCVGGYISQVARMAGVPVPIVTHPLQAFVTESYEPVMDTIVASSDLHMYVSQTARGELLVGAEIERYASYSTRSTFTFLSDCAGKTIDLFPFMAKLRILRQWTGVCDMTPDYSPIMGTTPVERFYIDTGMGTWGFKLSAIAGVTMAELAATGRVPDLIKPFALSRFRENRAVSERASAGTH